MVDQFYKGFEELNKKKKVRAIVSFRTTTLEWPSQDKSRYWVNKWLPQIELLNHPALKAGLTHCGLGGTLEFINAGKPVLTFPHFGDQMDNASNLVDAGAGLHLIPPNMANRPVAPQNFFFKDAVFTASDFAAKTHRLITEPSFREAAMTMKVAAVAAGGGKKAEKTIRDFYIAC
jgi:UDP:flavonoid glycosyltransferase YjiC (YdhE family)